MNAHSSQSVSTILIDATLGKAQLDAYFARLGRAITPDEALTFILNLLHSRDPGCANQAAVEYLDVLGTSGLMTVIAAHRNVGNSQLYVDELCTYLTH